MDDAPVPDLNAYHYANHSESQYDRVQKIIKHLRIRKEDSILDVGCGFGNIIAEISQIASKGSSVGIDASPNMIKLAKDQFPKSKFPNLEFLHMKAEQINFPENTFDIVLCTNALLWIREPHIALKLMCKCLRKRGKIIILTYSNNTPYANLFKKVLNQYFSSFSKLSAANTMLSEEEHLQILRSEGIDLEYFSTQNELFKYESREAFKDYVRGWLCCYVPLSKEFQELFLEKIVKESSSVNISKDKNKIIISHKIIIINGRKVN